MALPKCLDLVDHSVDVVIIVNDRSLANLDIGRYELRFPQGHLHFARTFWRHLRELGERTIEASNTPITPRRDAHAFKASWHRHSHLQLHLVHQKPRQYGAIVRHEDLHKLRIPNAALFAKGPPREKLRLQNLGTVQGVSHKPKLEPHPQDMR